MTVKKIAIIFYTVLSVFILQAQSYAQTTFPAGSAIIDMGSASPTVGNSLKPYGLVYGLLKSKYVPVSYVVNASKPKDGTDFIYNGKNYKGGTFIISADYISTDVTNYLNSWANQGVTIDYTSASAGDLTVNVTYKINFTPKWVMDKTNGAIAVTFLNAAGIPASAYSFKNASQLGDCDDIFVLPHADPTWNTHNNLYFWNKNNKGAIWAGCHAVSVMEGLSKDTTIGGTASTIKMNFLSTNGLLPFTDHNPTSTPFSHLLPGDPVAQYYNKTDAAQTLGSETVYLPKSGSAWNTGAKIITSSPSQSDLASLPSGTIAAENIYGRAFDDATRGYVGYEASHNISGTSADAIAAQRIFFNFSLLALNDKVPPIISASLSGNNNNQITAGSATSLTANVTGSGTGFTYQWSATVSGTFSAPNSATTTFTPSSSITSSTSCIITCVVKESCGRVSFDAKKVTVVPPPSSYTLLNRDTTISISGSCTVASVKFNVFTNNPDDKAGARTLVSVTGLGNGTVVTSTNGDVTFTSVANFKGKTTGTYIVTNGTSNSPSANISIIVGDSTLAPVITNDDVTVMMDNVSSDINVLSNDKNWTSASAGDSLYVRDITTKPSKGFAYINTNGTLSYLSTKDQSSTSDSFQYLACNTKGYCSVGTVNVTMIQDGCSAGQYQLTNTGTVTTTTFTPTIDTYITGSATSSNFSSTTSLIVFGFSNNLNDALIKFDLSGISSSATVNSAGLSLTTNIATFTPAATTNSFSPANVYGLLQPWTESGATWTKYDVSSGWGNSGVATTQLVSGTDYTTTGSATMNMTSGTAVPNGTVIGSSDLKTMVQGWVTTSSTNKGLVVIPSSSNNTGAANRPSFHSRETATSGAAPQLYVKYTTQPTCSTIPTNYKPLAYPDTASTPSNTAVTINVKSNDANFYGNSNSVTAVTTPAHGTASINGSNNIVYTPSGNFVGTDTLTYTITDGSNSQTAKATVRIIVTKVAPVVNRDSTSTNSNTAVTINVGANDSDPQETSSNAPTISTNPKNGTATISGNNIIYTPASKFTGNDTLIYKRAGTAADACSVALSDTALVVITVLNQAPVAVNDSIVTYGCTPVNIKIKDNDTDAEGGVLTVTIASNPTNGTVTANSDGSYRYSPNSGFTGTDQFTYTVKDPKNVTSNTATVKITVSGSANPNSAPVASPDADNTQVNQPVYTNVLSNDSDPNSDSLFINITAPGLKAPANGTIQLMGNNLIKYTPNANFTGTDTYEYQIKDSHPSCSGNSTLSSIALVTITVKPTPILTSGTVWNDVDYSANETFNNIKTNSETGTSINSSLYIYLTDSTNKILEATPVDDAGAFQLSSVPSNTSKLSLVISKEVLSVGGALTVPSLPSGWTNTSPTVRTFSTGTTDITGYDFGVVSTTVTGGSISSTSSGFCVSGTPGIISSTTNPSGQVSIQWQVSTTSGGSGYTDIAGATGNTYTPSAAITTTTWYRRKAIGSGSAYAFSNVVKVVVNPNPTVSINPATATVAPSGNATLTASGATTYTWSPSTNLSATSGSSVVVSPATGSSVTYTVTGTDDIGCTNTATVLVKSVTVPVAGSISGPCAVAKDKTKTYTVSATNATSFVWILPNGWTGSSTTNTINVKITTNTSGTITCIPYNGTVPGDAVTYLVNVIDFVKVDITGLPVIASGNNNSPVTVTIKLYDANGLAINCSGGAATLSVCNSTGGTFSAVTDNNDGTYTAKLTAFANVVNVCGMVDSVPIQKTINITFTGPQGGIKPSVPILETEIPKITFTASAGRSPFTIVYRSPRSNKNDTLTNVTSGQVISNPLIPATTQYRLLSILDANGETRLNNFDRDTATVVVVAPKVVITLHASPAKPDKDSTWITILTVKTKNIGDLPLSNSQAVLNLNTVFPNPVTWVLDSLSFSNGPTVTPNRTYDGVSKTDLFAKLNQHKPDMFIKSNAFRVEGLNDQMLTSPDGSSASMSLWNTSENSTEENEGYRVFDDGHNIYMFGAQSSLPVGVEADIVLYLHVKPNGYTDPFVMQAVALGTGHTDGATALTTSLSNDNNDINSHPEVTKQGTPVPAVINLFPTATVGTSLSAGTPVLQSNGSYNVLLTYKVRNYGNVNLTNINLYQNLLRSIGTPAVFNVVGNVTSSGNLIPNPNFDAKTDTNIVIPGGSVLGYKQESVLTYTINITPNQFSALYNLQATATAFSEDLSATVTDLSTDGTDPDPDGNNIPSEKIITQILINLTIPPVVPGKIGIKTGPSTTALTATYCGSANGVVIIPTSLNTGGSGSYTYQWQRSADNISFKDIVGAEDSTYTTGLVSTNFYLRRGTISGSQIKYSNSVYIQFNVPVKPIITGPGNFIIGKGPVTLTSSASTTYLWSTNATTQSIQATDPGGYLVTVTDVNGCPAVSDTFKLATLDPYKVADLKKELTKAPSLQSDGSFLLGFTFYASNLRTELLDSVKIKDDLSKVFPSGTQFQIVDIKASGKLIANANYNGNSNIDMLNDVSQLASLKTDSVNVLIKLTPNGFSGTLSNQAQFTARSPFGPFQILSNDSTVGNGVSVRNPTKFAIPVVDIFIPSGFSPNHDGVNDLFVITRPFNTTITLEIFNRWGNSVYKVADYKNDWDGRGNQPNRVLGDELPDGTYYYLVTATDKFTGGIRKFAGFVTLKR